MSVARRIMESMNNKAIPHAASSVSKHVTLSIGIASMLPKFDKSTSDLIFAADAALYQAKLQGRNRICVHAGE